MMLVGLMVLTFLGSFYAFRFATTALGAFLPAPMAVVVAAVAYVAFLLGATWSIARVRPQSQRVPISFAFAGLIGMYLPLLKGIDEAFRIGISTKSWTGVAAIFGLCVAWGLIANWLMEVVLGRERVEAYWRYVQETCSTFRKT